jgi:serine/threonine protein kinase, bacterial
MIGQLLGERYKIISVLGAGGMGWTYVAEDTQRPGNPRCVVKQMKPARNNPKSMAMARRLFSGEAEILERLGSHDQIPRLLAYFEQNQEFYLAQELIEGQPLSQEISSGYRWSEPNVIKLLQEIATILAYVHDQNVIHRDIKPSNIIRRRQDGKLVLIDFGAVKQVRLPQAVAIGQAGNPANYTASETVSIGTPGYMPTEQLKGKPCPSSDIYALGMVGIQAITGLLPTQLLENEDGEWIWRPQTEVSDELANLLTKMVRHYFKHRHQSVLEVLEDLQPLSDAIATASQPLFYPEYTSPQAASTFGYLPTQYASPSQYEITPRSPDVNPFDTVPFETETQAGLPAALPNRPQPLPPSPLLANSFNPVNPGLNSTNGIHPSNRIQATNGIHATQIVAPPPVYPSIAHTYTPKGSLRKRLLVWGGLVGAVLSIGGGYWFRNAQSQQQATLKQLKVLPQITTDPEVQALLGECQLGKAQYFAKEGHLKDAISVVSLVPKGVPVYAKSQKLLSEWSERMMALAIEQYEAGQLDSAIALTQLVPKNSSVYRKAQDSARDWKASWQPSQDYLKAAQDAFDRGQWQQAIDSANQIAAPYWQKQADSIRRQANAEIAARQAVPPPTRTQPHYVPPASQYVPPASQYMPPDPVSPAPPQPPKSESKPQSESQSEPQSKPDSTPQPNSSPNSSQSSPQPQPNSEAPLFPVPDF